MVTQRFGMQKKVFCRQLLQACHGLGQNKMSIYMKNGRRSVEFRAVYTIFVFRKQQTEKQIKKKGNVQ